MFVQSRAKSGPGCVPYCRVDNAPLSRYWLQGLSERPHCVGDPLCWADSLNLWFIVRHLCLLSDPLLGDLQGMMTLVSKKGEGDQDRKTLGQFVLQRKESDQLSVLNACFRLWWNKALYLVDFQSGSCRRRPFRHPVISFPLLFLPCEMPQCFSPE